MPVISTVAAAYGFAFRRYLTVLGIVWLPLAILVAIVYLFMTQIGPDYLALMHQAMISPKDIDPATASDISRWVLPFDVIVLVLFIMMRVGITKEVLGMRTGPRFLYVSFGGAEFRLLAAYILVFLMIAAAAIGFALIVGILALIGVAAAGAHGGANSLSGPAGIAAFVVCLAAALAFVYAFVRLTFFLAPAAVTEKTGIGIARSWRLGKGNFWRIVAAMFLIAIPILVAEIVIAAVWLGPFIAALVQATPHGDKAVADAIQSMLQSYFRDMPYVLVFGFVAGPVLYGLLFSPPAFAYRAMEEEAKSAT